MEDKVQVSNSAQIAQNHLLDVAFRPKRTMDTKNKNMEKKEKALELFNKCKLHIIDTYPYENVKNTAKLICNEILDVIEDDGILLASDEYHDKKTVEYWLGVKEEIDLINWETLCPQSNS